MSVVIACGNYQADTIKDGDCYVCGGTKEQHSPYQKSRDAFNSYAAMDKPNLPANDAYSVNLSAIQVRFARWHANNFDTNTREGKAVGISEEIGELAEAFLGLIAASGRISHAVLKNSQGNRGMGDETVFRAAAADAIADSQIFAMQLCTLLRIDYGTLLKETAEKVLKRNWKEAPVAAVAKKPEIPTRKCTRCNAIFIDDGQTFCVACDVETCMGPGTVPDAGPRVAQLRQWQQACVVAGYEGRPKPVKPEWLR